MSERYYLDAPLGLGPVELDGPEAHHLASVCRARPGEDRPAERFFLNQPFSRTLAAAYRTGRIKRGGQWVEHPIDEAKAYRTLLSTVGLTQDQLAELSKQMASGEMSQADKEQMGKQLSDMMATYKKDRVAIIAETAAMPAPMKPVPSTPTRSTSRDGGAGPDTPVSFFSDVVAKKRKISSRDCGVTAIWPNSRASSPNPPSRPNEYPAATASMAAGGAGYCPRVCLRTFSRAWRKTMARPAGFFSSARSPSDSSRRPCERFFSPRPICCSGLFWPC